MDLYLSIAKEYVQEVSEADYEFSFLVGGREDFYSKVYYDFLIITKNNEPLSSPVGGAPGFIIDKSTLLPETISWGHLSHLKNRKQDLQILSTGLGSVSTRKMSLIDLKYKYNLTSQQLLVIQNIAKDYTDSEEMILALDTVLPQTYE